MRNHFFVLSLLIFSCLSLQAQTPPLLRKGVVRWLGERDNWAFTLHVREFNGGKVKEDRIERYDPSKPGIDRWQLIAVDGNPPTDDRRADWQKRKTKKRKNPGKPLDEYLEFEHATAVKETEKTISYHVPLRNNNSWLFPVEKVELTVSVDKNSFAIENIVAGIDEPFKVALGLARVLDVDLDMQMNPSEVRETATDPALAKPDGKAKVVVNRFGERIEYTWSDFKRVGNGPMAKTKA